MKKLITIFDHARDVPEPQISAIYDAEIKEVEFIPLYLKSANNSIKTIKDSMSKIFDTIKNNDVLINDTMSHMISLRDLGHKPSTKYNIFESRLFQKIDVSLTERQLKKNLLENLIKMPKELCPWMSIKAKSSAVYAELMDRGLLWGPHHEHPVYDTGTLTGRSRTRGFNIQGMTHKDPIRHTDADRNMFLCFDWVSADMRVAGFLSGDDFINNSFIESDPYMEMEKLLDADDISRDDCKIEMLKSIYSVNFDGPLLDVMPRLKKWMSTKKSEYNNKNTLKTMLGMPIPREDLKSSFSGMIQGSIAEAIQSVLIRISEEIGSECILTEIHDSLIVCCSDTNLKETINQIVPIMLKPFKNIDLKFPVKVSVGKKWKQWKTYKVYR